MLAASGSLDTIIKDDQAYLDTALAVGRNLLKQNEDPQQLFKLKRALRSLSPPDFKKLCERFDPKSLDDIIDQHTKILKAAEGLGRNRPMSSHEPDLKKIEKSCEALFEFGIDLAAAKTFIDFIAQDEGEAKRWLEAKRQVLEIEKELQGTFIKAGGFFNLIRSKVLQDSVRFGLTDASIIGGIIKNYQKSVAIDRSDRFYRNFMSAEQCRELYFATVNEIDQGQGLGQKVLFNYKAEIARQTIIKLVIEASANINNGQQDPDLFHARKKFIVDQPYIWIGGRVYCIYVMTDKTSGWPVVRQRSLEAFGVFGNLLGGALFFSLYEYRDGACACFFDNYLNKNELFPLVKTGDADASGFFRIDPYKIHKEDKRASFIESVLLETKPVKRIEKTRFAITANKLASAVKWTFEIPSRLLGSMNEILPLTIPTKKAILAIGIVMLIAITPVVYYKMVAGPYSAMSLIVQERGADLRKSNRTPESRIVKDGSILESRDRFQVSFSLKKASDVLLLYKDSHNRVSTLAEGSKNAGEHILPASDKNYVLDDATGEEFLFLVISQQNSIEAADIISIVRRYSAKEAKSLLSNKGYDIRTLEFRHR